MSRGKFNFDLGFQFSLLNLMINDESFLLKSKIHLKNEYFENDYLGYFFKKILVFYSKYDVLPNLQYFVNEIKKFDTDKRDVYVHTLYQIYQAIPISDKYIKDNLEDWIKRNRFVRFYEKLPGIYSDNPDRAYQYALEKAEDIVGFTFGDEEIVRLGQADSLIEEGRDKRFIAPIGIPQIDSVLGSGIKSGEVCTWLGDSGVGKSIILVNCGANSLIHGGKVLHINLEGTKAMPVLRYLSRLSGVPYNSIVTGMFKDEEEKQRYLSIKQQYDDQIYIIHMTSFSITIEEVYAKCKEVYKIFPFDVLVLDYGDLLTTKDKMELRHQQTTVFRGLTRIASIFQVPVLTASQATRPQKEYNTNSNTWITPRNMSESYEKVRVSSVIISINRTDREEIENKIRVMLCKNRDGIKNIKVGCYTNYSLMTPYSINYGFYDPKSEIISEGMANGK